MNVADQIESKCITLHLKFPGQDLRLVPIRIGLLCACDLPGSATIDIASVHNGCAGAGTLEDDVFGEEIKQPIGNGNQLLLVNQTVP